jgi:hypothetical protein
LVAAALPLVSFAATPANSAGSKYFDQAHPGAPEWRFVEWRTSQTMARLRADVAHVQQEVQRQLVLHTQVVVVDGRDLALRREARDVQREQGVVRVSPWSRTTGGTDQRCQARLWGVILGRCHPQGAELGRGSGTRFDLRASVR